MNRSVAFWWAMFLCVFLGGASLAQAEDLKPFVLGITPTGSFAEVIRKTESAVKGKGFKIVGSYAPYPGAMVICATNNELLTAASKARNGGFGAAQRIAVTQVNDKIQVSYVNPTYIGTAYGMGKLESVSKKLEDALGMLEYYGAKGEDPEKLEPGKYHYAMLMPYFYDVSLLNRYPDYQSAVAAVEKNLGAGKGGTLKVYRIDLPGKNVSVFGVGIPVGDGPNKGKKDTDKEILDIIDFQDIRSTAYLPYEMMVQDNEVIALPGRYRIAVFFPDTRMVGKHGFTKIMSSPGGIKKALEAASGYDPDKGFAADQ